MQSRPAAWAIVTTLALTLTACSGDSEPGDDPSSPEGAATALAEGLGAGDLAGVEFVSATHEDVTADYRATVEGMGDVTPTVEPGDVEEDGDAATATLAWSWPVGPEGEEWTYESQASLVRTDDTWEVTWDRALVEPSLKGGTRLDLTPVEARRGVITGAGGQALVTPRPVVRIGLDKGNTPKARLVESAEALARAVDIDVAPYVALAKAAGDLAFVEAIVYRNDEVPQSVLRVLNGIKGGIAVPDDLPLGPTRGFATPILGTVGEVTAEMIKEQPDVYEIGDEAGLSGLQQRYDQQLQGAPGAVVNAVTSDDKERELFRVDARQGKPLKLTMDLELQLAAEALLSDVGPASAIVAIRPSDGAILAAANGPGTGGYNMATFGQFAPGSTFKSVSSLALLRAGLGADDTVSCSPTVTVDGKSFKNYSDYPSSGIGAIPFRTAVANSCNTAFISERDRLGGRDLAEAAASLGMGIDHDLGFPAYFGSVEPPESETGKAADMIGQGTVLASPMVMATVIASVQEGRLVVPRLVEQVEVTAPDHAKLTGAEAGTLQSLLRGVVTSGSGSALADVPGAPVIAKTGTAEFERDGAIRTHAWMIAAQGDLAVAVFVEEGESGSQTAGPLLEAFLRAAG
ncbi:MAG: penicillin-binding transpeptidase domain-containing protein [Actinomycetota bacterium]|nr:penicillin-binding transpeptidase domain-containing protein [Actinomycetota bacterium]